MAYSIFKDNDYEDINDYEKRLTIAIKPIIDIYSDYRYYQGDLLNDIDKPPCEPCYDFLRIYRTVMQIIKEVCPYHHSFKSPCHDFEVFNVNFELKHYLEKYNEVEHDISITFKAALMKEFDFTPEELNDCNIDYNDLVFNNLYRIFKKYDPFKNLDMAAFVKGRRNLENLVCHLNKKNI